ncbi:MAG: hypothetical protein K0S08_2110 [Gammaproteobacteria bacterium]|jgi:hypothetical protein|nr:hypothetical protein [Gammaproteobacteria bacterium]
MSKLHPQAKEKINTYIAELPDFSQKICAKLRSIILKAIPQVIEDWKWGPNYQYPAGNMICGFGAFKAWVTLTFFNGASMKDANQLFNYGEKNAHNRSIKFTSIEEIDEKTLINYLQEAITISSNPLAKSNIKPTLIIPDALKRALNNKHLTKQFEALPYTKRKEYIQAIEQAKKEETKINRIEKIIAALKH